MATYTMQLRTLIEQPSQYESGLSTKDVIEKGRQTLFDFDYPIFDENYRKVFETHFIRHFYMREIGFETEGLFKFQLETWLMIHMPYFNRMFESELLDFDPLENVHYNITDNKTSDANETETKTTEQNETNNATANVVSNGTSGTISESTGDVDSTNTVTEDDFKRSLDADNPDNRIALTLNDGEGVLDYASKITEQNENNTATSTGNTTSANTVNSDTTVNSTDDSTINGTSTKNVNDNQSKQVNEIEDYISLRSGKIGDQSYSKMLQEYRQTFLRIEQQIFDEMQQLFMLIY